MSEGPKRGLAVYVEIAGAVAVVVSLVFVGYELRQNTQAVHASTMQALTDGSQEYMLQVGSDPGLAAIRLKVRNSEELTELEAEQWRQIRIARWVRMQNAYLQYHRGSIDDDGWSYYEQLICRADPAEWEQHKSGMLELFAAFVDSCLEQDQ